MGRLLLPRPFWSCLSTPAADSPGVPPSAGAHQLFRGFSFVATGLMEDGKVKPAQPPLHSVVQVRTGDRGAAPWRCRGAAGALHHLEPDAVLFGTLGSCSSISTDCHTVHIVGLGLSCPQVDLCWQGLCNARGLCSQRQSTVLSAGALTHTCLVLLPGEGMCRQLSLAALCAALTLP